MFFLATLRLPGCLNFFSSSGNAIGEVSAMEVRPQRVSRAVLALTVLLVGAGAFFYFWVLSRSAERVPRRARFVNISPAPIGEYSNAPVRDYLGRLQVA